MLPQLFFQSTASLSQKLALSKRIVNSSFFRDMLGIGFFTLFMVSGPLIQPPTQESQHTYDAYTDPVIVRVGDGAYEIVEEAALAAGQSRPFLEGPASVGALWRAASKATKTRSALNANAGSTLTMLGALLPTPSGPAVADFILTLSGGWETLPDGEPLYRPDQFDHLDTTDPDKPVPVFSTGKRNFLDPVRFSNLLDRAPLLDLRFLFRAGPVALDLNPVVRPSSSLYRDADGFWTNAVALTQPDRIDVNFPFRGITSVYVAPFEFRLGRDKLQLGPGRHSSLGIAYNLPWVDYASAKGDFGPFSLSWYLIALNPVITEEEENYLLALRAYPELQLEDNSTYQLQGLERSKNLVAARMTWRPFPWFTVALTQHHLVGGRYLQIFDVNPFIIYHNLFQEGVYSVPPTTDFSFVPIRGLELYWQGMIYDATVADEVDTGNAAAYGWQFGLTAISTPWFATGPGRLRLDLEYVISDPWMYGKYSSWRQFTSRFISVEPYAGRFWVDYPIGFHLGPDARELWGKLAYGIPGSSNISLEASYSIRGSIALLGYGPVMDYADKEAFEEMEGVMVRDGQVPEKHLKTGLSLDFRPQINYLPGNSTLKLTLRTELNALWGYGFAQSENRLWANASASVSWAF